MFNNQERVLKFEKELRTGDLIARNVGRFWLGDGTVVRILLDDKGVFIAVPRNSDRVVYTEPNQYSMVYTSLGKKEDE